MQVKLLVLVLLSLVAVGLVAKGPKVVKQSSHVDVLAHIYNMPRTSSLTGFPYSLSEWQKLVDGKKDVPEDGPLATVAPFLNAARKFKKRKVSSEKRHAVVVGAGPVGLVAAMKLKHKGFGVTVLEKTDGKDERYNSVVVKDAVSGFVHDLMAINLYGEPRNARFGRISELELLYGAFLVLSGVDMRYNTQYTRHCTTGTNSHSVITRTTPRDRSSRILPSLQVTCGAQHAETSVIKNVGVVVGADGTHSWVRKVQDWRFNPVEDFDIALGEPKPHDAFNPSKRDQFKAWLSSIVSKKTPPKTGEWRHTFKTTGKELSDFRMYNIVINMKGLAEDEIGRLQGQMNNGHLPVAVSSSPADIKDMLLGKTALDRKSTVAACFAQKAVDVSTRAPDNKKKGSTENRAYLDIMLRHNAGKAWAAAFSEDLIDEEGTLEKLTAYVKGDFVVDELSKKQKKAADHMMNALWEIIGKPSALGDSVTSFKGHIDKIKMWGQRLRQTSETVGGTPDMLVVLAGDSTRDSYFLHGNSFNSAAAALLDFFDSGGLTMKSRTRRDTAKDALYREAVDYFADTTAASLYTMGYCGFNINSYGQLAKGDSRPRLTSFSAKSKAGNPFKVKPTPLEMVGGHNWALDDRHDTEWGNADVKGFHDKILVPEGRCDVD